MGIWVLLRRLEDEKLSRLATDPKATEEFLAKHPVFEEEPREDGKKEETEEQKKKRLEVDRYDLDVSFDVVNFLMGAPLIMEDYTFPSSKGGAVELRQSTKRGTKLYFVVIQHESVHTYYGPEHSFKVPKNTTALDPKRGNLGVSKQVTSSPQKVDAALTLIRSKVKEGYKLSHAFITQKAADISHSSSTSSATPQEEEKQKIGTKRKASSSSSSSSSTKKAKTDNVPEGQVDITKWTVAQLKAELMTRGLSVDGVRLELEIRLLFDDFGLTVSENPSRPPLLDAPLDFMTCGGIEVGASRGLAFGSARGQFSDQVKATAKALLELTDEEFMKNYNEEKMINSGVGPGKFFPANPTPQTEANNREFALLHFHGMREWLQNVAEKNQAILLYLF